MNPDDNDALRAGHLPHDPGAGLVRVLPINAVQNGATKSTAGVPSQTNDLASPATGAADARVRPVRLSLADVRNPPAERFVLGRMIPFGKSSVLFGPTGGGKTALEAMIAAAHAAGASSLWGLPLLPGGGPVLVWTLEDTLDDWKRKLAAIEYAGGVDVERALERLYIVDRTEQIVRLSEVATIRVEEGAETVSRRRSRATEEHAHLVADIKETGATLVLFETTSRAVEDEDNANFSGLRSVLGAAARTTGAAVLASHHATKAATRENDSAIESARGGGALIANARNALALFPAEPDVATAYAERFPAEDVFTLTHGKSTSSTRRHPPIVLVRCDAKWGAVFRLPDEMEHTPEHDLEHNARMEVKRQHEVDQLGRLYDVVAELARLGPVSFNRLRGHEGKFGATKRTRDDLVLSAVKRGVLRTEPFPRGSGTALLLGQDPRKSVPDAGGTTRDEVTP